MPWVVTFSIPKDPLIYQDEKKRKDYMAGMRQGLGQRIKEMPDIEELPLLIMNPPFDCRLIFHEESEARRMNPWGFPQEGRIIRFHSEEFMEMYQNLLKIAYFPKLAYTFRTLVIPLTRVFWRIQSWKHP